MKELSKCEEHVMIGIWNSECVASMKSVRVDVNKQFKKEWAPQTISTFLTRLRNKEFIEMKRKGRVIYYHPTVSKEEYRKTKLHELLNDLYNGDIEALKADLKK